MNRNTESHFSLEPALNMSRSKFDRSFSVKTTFNTGDLVPFYLEEVLPGDTFNVKSSKVVRMPSLLTPVMDNIFLDTYYFFVPNRLVWNHWKEFMGENTESAWIPATEYQVPQITAPATTGWSVGTIADYFGIPTGVAGLSVSALPFRAYALICNEWFRDQNLTDPLVVPMDDSTVAGLNDGNELDRIAKGGKPFRAAKYHDYFTSCLPGPQKGADVLVPGGSTGFVPVVTRDVAVPHPGGFTLSGIGAASNSSTGDLTPYNTAISRAGASSGLQVAGSSYLQAMPKAGDTGYGGGFDPTNLWVSPEAGTAVGATINQLRLAFQIQKYYEKLARGGSRYTEVIRSFFGVTSPDARLQRPEYLGGNRIPITINQVIQQSGTQSSGTPQGTVVGMSQTTDTHADFVKSFTEHGYIIGLMVARYDHTYQNGLARMWSRKDKFDFYWPVFANIGEQAVKNKEIFAAGTDDDDKVFGYQEAWADYRYKPNIVTGDMRSNSTQSLDVWHLADDYETCPRLSDEWIRESPASVNRILAVSDQLSHQFFADIYVQNDCTRPMPLYSIPGLIDHH